MALKWTIPNYGEIQLNSESIIIIELRIYARNSGKSFGTYQKIGLQCFISALI